MTLYKAFKSIKAGDRNLDRAIDIIRLNREKSIPGLLDIIEAAVENPMKIPNDFRLVNAMLFLSEFRVKEAFKYIVELLKLDDDFCEYIMDEFVTESMPIVLANVMTEKDIDKIKVIIEDENIDFFNKGVAVKSLVAAQGRGILGKDELFEYFEYLAEKYVDDAGIMSEIACCAEFVRTPKIIENVKNAIRNGVVDEELISVEDYEEGIARPLKTGEDIFSSNEFIEGKATAEFCFGDF